MPLSEQNKAPLDPYGRCTELPEHMNGVPAAELYRVLDFANEVQTWALRQEGEPTFGDAAIHFGVSVPEIANSANDELDAINGRLA